MFTKTNLLYAYYGIIGIKNVYENIKKENKKGNSTEDLIDAVLSENKELSKKEKKKYLLKKVKINRKIPDKKELDNIFNDFIQNNKIIKVKKTKSDNYFEKIINNKKIIDMNYFNFDFLLNENTFYKIVININLKNIKDCVKILFLITDKIKSLKHEIILKKNNNNISIILNNIFFNESKDIDVYLIFKHFNYDLYIENINLIIYKNNNVSNKLPILIIKKDIYKQYLFYNYNIFNLYNNLISF